MRVKTRVTEEMVEDLPKLLVVETWMLKHSIAIRVMFDDKKKLRGSETTVSL